MPLCLAAIGLRVELQPYSGHARNVEPRRIHAKDRMKQKGALTISGLDWKAQSYCRSSAPQQGLARGNQIPQLSNHVVQALAQVGLIGCAVDNPLARVVGQTMQIVKC